MEKTRGDPHAGVPKDRREKKGSRKRRAAAAVAIIIIIILAAGLLLPAAFRPSEREGHRLPQAAGNLKQIWLALEMYRQDHEEEYPPDLTTLVDEGHVTDPRVLASPRGPYSFRYVRPRIDTPAAEVLASELAPFDEGRWVLFIDGHVTWEEPSTPDAEGGGR